MNLNESRIRDLAYQIWESEGRPYGQAARHWEIACKLAAKPRSGRASGTGDFSQQQAETKPTRKPKTKSEPQMG